MVGKVEGIRVGEDDIREVKVFDGTALGEAVERRKLGSRDEEGKVVGNLLVGTGLGTTVCHEVEGLRRGVGEREGCFAEELEGTLLGFRLGDM